MSNKVDLSYMVEPNNICMEVPDVKGEKFTLYDLMKPFTKGEGGGLQYSDDPLIKRVNREAVQRIHNSWMRRFDRYNSESDYSKLKPISSNIMKVAERMLFNCFTYLTKEEILNHYLECIGDNIDEDRKIRSLNFAIDSVSGRASYSPSNAKKGSYDISSEVLASTGNAAIGELLNKKSSVKNVMKLLSKEGAKNVTFQDAKLLYDNESLANKIIEKYGINIRTKPYMTKLALIKGEMVQGYGKDNGVLAHKDKKLGSLFFAAEENKEHGKFEGFLPYKEETPIGVDVDFVYWLGDLYKVYPNSHKTVASYERVGTETSELLLFFKTVSKKDRDSGYEHRLTNVNVRVTASKDLDGGKIKKDSNLYRNTMKRHREYFNSRLFGENKSSE